MEKTWRLAEPDRQLLIQGLHDQRPLEARELLGVLEGSESMTKYTRQPGASAETPMPACIRESTHLICTSAPVRRCDSSSFGAPYILAADVPPGMS